MFFFPEGTRTKDGSLNAFKMGAFKLAADCGVPVVPITILGTGDLMPPGQELSFFEGPCTIIVHPMEHPRESDDGPAGLRDRVWAAIDRPIDEARRNSG